MPEKYASGHKIKKQKSPQYIRSVVCECISNEKRGGGGRSNMPALLIKTSSVCLYMQRI